MARRHLYAEDEDDGEDGEHDGHAHGGHDHHHHDHIAAPQRVRPLPQNLLARAFETAARERGEESPTYAYAGEGAGLAHGRVHDHDHEDDDDHDHHDHAEHSHVAVTPDQLRTGGWREALAVVLAIGLRPCSGALVVLVFALSQGVLWAGIASVFLMGLGTAITVAALATIAMTAKGLARRFARDGSGGFMGHLVWWGELAAAFMVFAFGILLAVAELWG